MQGTILHFDEISKTGILKSDEGARFEFAQDDWKSSGQPRNGSKIDFVAQNNKATEIYLLSGQGLSDNVSETLAKLQGSGAAQKVGLLFTSGMHNKFGFGVSFFALLSLFFPIFEVPMLGSVSLIDDTVGSLLFISLAVLTLFFYGGATQLYTRVLGGLVLLIFFFQYYDLFSTIYQANDVMRSWGGHDAPNLFNLVRWGAFVNIAACVVLFLAVFKKPYTSNPNTL